MNPPETVAIKEYKRHGGIIDGSQVAKFRRQQTEQFEEDDTR